MIFELLAAIFGLIQGSLSLLNKRIHWFFYLLQLIVLIIFSWNEKLYGDVIISIVFMFFCIVGFFFWNSKEYKHITSCTIKERFGYSGVVCLGTFIVYLFLDQTNDPLPFLDAFTTVLSIVALFYMVKHKIDTWFLWFTADAVYVVQYASLESPALYLLSLYVIWTLMAIASYWYWFLVLKKESKEVFIHKS